MSRDSFILLYINILKLFYYLTGMSIAATRFDNRIEYVVSVGVGHATFKNTALYFQLYGEHSWFNIFCFHFALSAAADALSESNFLLIAAADGISDYYFASSAAADGPSESNFSLIAAADGIKDYYFALSAAADALSESNFSLIAAADGIKDYHFALSAAADGPSESFFSSSEQSDNHKDALFYLFNIKYKNLDKILLIVFYSGGA
jgi:hypothetical protein